MAVSTHIPNSTVPDCRMRVPRRRNISTAQSWPFVSDAMLLGHRRTHTAWVPARTPAVNQCPHSGKAVGSSTAHTSTWHRIMQQTRMSPKQTHEVTNTDSVIRAHGSGACCGYTAKQGWSMNSRAESVDAKDIESPRNRDTANEELSTMTEYLTKLNDMCAVETEVDDICHPEHCAQPWARESWMECKLSWVESLKIKGNMMLAMLTWSSESADTLGTTQMIPCHQESQCETHQCQTY